MNVIKTKLQSVLIIEPIAFQDDRGYFMETYNEKRYQAAGIVDAFVQDNISVSVQNVVRGLHYQLKHPQGKLVSVIYGKAWDVVVDIRHGSPQFGEWIGIEISDENKRQVYIPPGFAHGYCALSEEVFFHYQCSDYYHPEDEYGIHWSDPGVGVAWPILGVATVSFKDGAHPLLQNILPHHLPVFERVK